MTRFILALSLLCLTAPASAADFLFTSTNPTYNNLAFSIATAPTPDGSDDISFTINNVLITEAGEFGPLVFPKDFVFYSDAVGGFFASPFGVYSEGPLFGGTNTAPIFYNGTFTLFDDFFLSDEAGSLAITNGAIAPVPEPATWAMMIVGMGLAGFALRRRRGGAAAVVPQNAAIAA